ncbi:hypothetical protein ACGFYP_11740 [Streptomyces sp. NPDC048370]|uniref:hypothetical protein n=1 Tax=Streptomyces sp. NPDC048370 TaxID=3365540 RepID=UPI0037166D66
METQQEHEAVFNSGVNYYIFSFDAGGPIDIRKSADRLLRAGIAETVVSPRNGEVRVAQRYQDLVDLVSHTATLQDLGRVTEEGGLFGWMIRHPIWAARLFGRALTGSRGGEGADREGTPASELLSENLNFIYESVARQQSVNAIQNYMENELLNPSYLQSEPYLRLHLRGARQWLTRLGGGTLRTPGNLDEGVITNALLLIHRSGAMQLTIALRLPDEITLDQYREFSFGGSNIVSVSSIPEPLLKAASGRRGWEKELAGHWEDDVSSGTRWRMVEHASPASVADLFELYAVAISRTLGHSSYGSWFCYPATFVDQVTCCATEEDFKRNHSLALDNAIARSIDIETVRPESRSKVIPEEGSLTLGKSLYCDPSSALEIRWSGTGRVEFEHHLWTLLILESALLQYWQIRLLDSRISVTSGKLKAVRDLQLEVIFGLREYRDSGITYGTALELTERLLSGWRVDKRYGHVLESLDQLQQLAVAAESIRGGRRANLLAAVALVVAIFLGLPAVNDTLEIAEKVKASGLLALPLGPFQDLARRGERGAWIGYLLFLAAVALPALILAFSRWTRSFRRPRRREPGLTWPFLLTVDDSDTPPSDTP